VATELEKIRDRLRRKLATETSKLLRYDQYFESEQPLSFIVPALKEELGDRLTALVVEFPRTVVFAYDDRLDIRGYRLPDAEEADDDLWDVQLANNGGFLGQQVRQECLALGRAYKLVGPGDDPGVPLITAESPFDCMHELDPRTGAVANGIKQWTELDGARFITLYQPGGRTTWVKQKRRDWVLDDETETGYDLAQLVPYTNQPRTLGRARTQRSKYDQRLGRSEFHGILPLADGVNKMATDMMTSGEYHAMPRRWVFGMDRADFEDADGNPLSDWSAIAGKIWAHQNKDVKAGQFTESSLSNFHESIKLLGQLIIQQAALPPHYGFDTGDNPASADAIRSSETQLVKRSERKQVSFGTSDELEQRLVLLEAGRTEDAEKAKRIEVIWRSASTPTKAQESDATVKLVTAKDSRGRSIVPIEMAREDLGYTPEQRKRMAAMDKAEDPDIAAAARELRTLTGNTAA